MSLVLVITNLILSIVNFPPYNEQVPHAVVFAVVLFYCGNFTIFFHSSQEVFHFFQRFRYFRSTQFVIFLRFAVIF